MGERIERLKQVAQCGDVETLYVLIQEDALIIWTALIIFLFFYTPHLDHIDHFPFFDTPHLDHIDHSPFFDSPLHIAVCNGHILFAKEMVRLKREKKTSVGALHNKTKTKNKKQKKKQTNKQTKKRHQKSC